MKTKVVIGASYGDEGKGLVSGCLAREAAQKGERVLTVFYNGTLQRAHTFEGVIHRGTAAGTSYGSDTFYDAMFVVDPIAIALIGITPIIHPNCRVILPCDVLKNRKIESDRGTARHGSCGCGLFEAVKRFKSGTCAVTVGDFTNPYELYQKVKMTMPAVNDDLYNMDNFMRAIAFVTSKCTIARLEEVAPKYDEVIFEGGQGLMLDQSNMDFFPHLTPSSVGLTNITDSLKAINATPELYYVSRSYMTRHGAGRMEDECAKESINPNIVDTTNVENPWQGALRFGRINMETLYDRIQKDAAQYQAQKKINLVFTQLNYTDGKLETTNGRIDIVKPEFANSIFVSDQKDYMEKLV